MTISRRTPFVRAPAGLQALERHDVMFSATHCSDTLTEGHMSTGWAVLTTALILCGLFGILLALERWLPLRQATQPVGERLLVNLSISALAIGTAAALVQPAGATALEFVSKRGFGLLSWLEVPAAARFVIAFVLLDLSFYY